MLKHFLLRCGAVAVLAGSVLGASAADDDLFNGKDLTGWQGDPKIWSVRDGAITGQTTPNQQLKANTFLVWTNGTVGDFELRLHYRLIPSENGFANSGIQYRSKLLDKSNWVVGGYQADLEAGPNYSGILYEEKGRGIMAMPGEKVTWDAQCKKQVAGKPWSANEIQSGIRPGDWNEYTIVAQGNRLKHYINGRQTIEVTDECAKKAAADGVIALQMHVGAPFTAQFKDIRLKRVGVGGPSKALTIVSYNLRFANNNPGERWVDRRPLVADLVKSLGPDVMGTQEGVYSQIKDLAQDLPGYEWVGVGRDDGKTAGEFMAVYYRKARLQPLSTNHFWLSDTPEVPGSATWGNTNKRMATWLKFRDLETGREFYFINTHFDHRVQLARERSSELILTRVRALDGKLPVILTGDFNAAAGANKAYDILIEGGFKDTWMTAGKRSGEGYGTFNGFKALQKNGARIDWILTRGRLHVESAAIVLHSDNGVFPSDHCPVLARVTFPVE